MCPASRSVLAALAFGVALWAGFPRAVRAQVAASELGRPILHNYTPGTYLGGYLCQAVTQDAAGMIYVGNDVAIRVFDGRDWSPITLPVESGGVREFATGADGRIYAGGPSLIGYLRGSGPAAEFVSLAGRLPPAGRNIDEIRHVAAVGNAVCFSDEEKLFVWRGDHFVIVPCPAPAGSHGARLHAVGNTLYVTRPGHPLCRLAGDRLEPVADDPVLRENQIIAIESGDAGGLRLLTAERGYFQLGANGRVAPLDSAANRWLVGRRIFRALRLADGSLAVVFSAASGEGGLRLAADGTYLGPLDLSIGLVVQALYALYADREGGLWIGEQFGLSRLEWPSAATRFDVVNGLGQGEVNDVVRHDGTLYAATEEGLFRLRPGDDHGRGALFERVLGRPVRALLSHPAGLLALGDSEIFAVTGSEAVSIAPLPAGGGVLRRSRRDPALVWVGTGNGIHALRHTGRGWRDDGRIPAFRENCVGLGEAGDGSLWAATADGALCRIELSPAGGAATGARMTRFTGGDGLPEHFTRVHIGMWGGEPVFFSDGGVQPFRFDATRRQFRAVDEGGA
ncbi:MAG TPA: hypothetical protein VG710_17410, partial [Opitutus sp.]|nr:hypothetical protein [Opitutus sp.]